MLLKDKIALITGGTQGIGKAIAERFIKEGARAIICGRNKKTGEATAKELGGNCEYYQVDVSKRDQVQAWVDDVIKKHKRIDILVNNAGIANDGPLVTMKNDNLVSQMSEEAFDSVIDVNLKGTFNCAQAVSPIMIRQLQGVILNTSSVTANNGSFGLGNYVASKEGINGLTKVWSRELGKHNIRVNVVAPGFTDTNLVDTIPKEALENIIRQIPLKRLAKPEEIANAYAFLASDEASFINGASLRVDGGHVMGT